MTCNGRPWQASAIAILIPPLARAEEEQIARYKGIQEENWRCKL